MNDFSLIADLPLLTKVSIIEKDWNRLIELNPANRREVKIINHFSHGVYARELHIPVDTFLTGEIHKFENLNILSKGSMSVLTNYGVQDVEAPFTIVSPPGTKRIAYTYTDCVWTTIHGTFEKDIDKIKEFFIASSEQEYLEFCGQLQLELNTS